MIHSCKARHTVEWNSFWCEISNIPQASPWSRISGATWERRAETLSGALVSASVKKLLALEVFWLYLNNTKGSSFSAVGNRKNLWVLIFHRKVSSFFVLFQQRSIAILRSEEHHAKSSRERGGGGGVFVSATANSRPRCPSVEPLESALPALPDVETTNRRKKIEAASFEACN